jgi:hypothetical protein
MVHKEHGQSAGGAAGHYAAGAPKHNVNELIRKTGHYNSSIQRHKDGGLTVHWQHLGTRRTHEGEEHVHGSNRVTREGLSQATGLAGHHFKETEHGFSMHIPKAQVE